MNAITRPHLRWPAWFAHRPEASVELIALLASVFFAVFANNSFWRAVSSAGALGGGSGVWVTVCIFVAVVAITNLLLSVLLNRWTVKPLLTVLLLVTAGAAHFMSQYGVYLDTG
ncbi:MAG: phosphoethanolamine transferase domain-containing protein, partial [Lysobacter sp.]